MFPDLLARDLSTRLRLQSLSDALDPDPTALTDLTAVLDSDHVVRMSGCHENEAMNRLLDDLWCSTRALRRAVLDDAHARAVLSVRIAAMQREYVGEAPALEAPPAPDVEHPSALETIRATLRSAEAVPLRDVLTSLLAHLPDAPSGVDASLEPVTDEPLFRLDGDDWKFEVVAPMAAHEQRNFWDVETPLRRERRAWPNFRTPQVRVTS